MKRRGSGRAALLATCCAWAAACAGSLPPPTTPDAAGPTPGSESTAALVELGATIQRDVDGLTALVEPLPGRVAGLPTLPVDVAPADLDPDIVRAGLKACFAARGEGACSAPQVVTLLDWATTTGEPMRAAMEAKLADVSFLRSALGIVMTRSTGVMARMAQARVEAERIVGERWSRLDRTKVNPLESARVKAATQAEFDRLLAARDGLDKLASRVETEVRPLGDRALALHKQVTEALARFGDVTEGASN